MGQAVSRSGFSMKHMNHSRPPRSSGAPASRSKARVPESKISSPSLTRTTLTWYSPGGISSDSVDPVNGRVAQGAEADRSASGAVR